MIEPPRWTLAELRRDAETAKGVFRQQRLSETQSRYSEFIKAFKPVLAETVDLLPQLQKEPPNVGLWAELVGDKDRLTALRYLAAPPISDDDLKTLADATLSPEALRRDTNYGARHSRRRVPDHRRTPLPPGRRS